MHSKQYKNGTYVIRRIHDTNTDGQLNSPLKRTFWSEAEMLQRRKVFKSRLLDRVKAYHQEYLEENGLEDKPSYGVDYWHSSFPLEELPDIEEGLMPTLALPTSPPPKKKVLASVTKTSTKLPSSSSELLKNTISKELKGVNHSTISKIRNKEQISKMEDTPEMRQLKHKKFVLSTIPQLAEKLRS